MCPGQLEEFGLFTLVVLWLVGDHGLYPPPQTTGQHRSLGKIDRLMSKYSFS